MIKKMALESPRYATRWFTPVKSAAGPPSATTWRTTAPTPALPAAPTIMRDFTTSSGVVTAAAAIPTVAPTSIASCGSTPRPSGSQ
jgi:hypothetical protein